MITYELERVLEMPFPMSAHSFVDGNVYLQKGAIRLRLSSVDPAWSQSAPQLVGQTENVIKYVGALTVCGVTRYGLGTGIITHPKARPDKTTGQMIEPGQFEWARAEAKADKSAVSDLLPRAANEFGVGAYLKRLPKGTRTEDALARILSEFPPHWTASAGGDRVRSQIAALELEPALVAMHIEPGRVIKRLAETWLSEDQFTARLLAIKHEQRAA